MMENISVNIKSPRGLAAHGALCTKSRLFMTQQSLWDPNWAIGQVLTIFFPSYGKHTVSFK